jgi:hypothetical protein
MRIISSNRGAGSKDQAQRQKTKEKPDRKKVIRLDFSATSGYAFRMTKSCAGKQ